MSAAGGAFAGIMIANNVARFQEGLAKARTDWGKLADRGMALGVEDGPAIQIERERPVLKGVITGVPCEIRAAADAVYYPRTEVTARLPGLGDETVGVHPDPGGLFASIRAWWTQDIEVGDPEFDRIFLVTARPDGAAARLLPPGTRERILALAAARFMGLTVGNGTITLAFHGVETDTDALGLALEAVAEIANAAKTA